MGFTGIVAYQFLENCAIYYTNASNIAILVSFGPIVTALMAQVLTKDRQLSTRLVVGSLIAVCGVSLVSLNGIVEFELRPLGDMMVLCAMTSWGLYSILIDVANERGINPLVAVRKSFGWSLIMMIPVAIWGMTESGICALDGSFAVIVDAGVNAARFSNLINWMNIAFLGLLASAVSFVLWSAVCRVLGVVKTTISLYLTPIVGVVFAAVFLGEKITLLGLQMPSRRKRPRKRQGSLARSAWRSRCQAINASVMRHKAQIIVVSMRQSYVSKRKTRKKRAHNRDGSGQAPLTQ